MKERQSALIVGAGPTGLVMAHELARRGVRCRLIDKNAHRAMESRAIAVHAHTVEVFALMGVADDFLAAGQRITSVSIQGERRPIAQLDLASLDSNYPFVLGIPQDETERILEEHVGRYGVPVERNTELIGLTPFGSGVSARLRSGDRVEEVEADWVLGCDGAHSAVRELSAIPFSGDTYPEHFVLADLRAVGGLEHAAGEVWLHEQGALAFFPLPGERYRLVVANSPPDWRDEPSLAQCQALLAERGPKGVRLADLRWSAVFRIHRREAARFRRDRVFLLGDAAHIHSPIGGQGMNMGIQDAFNLAWKLGLVIANGPNPALLDSYEAERKPVDDAVVRQTDRATRLVSVHSSVGRFIRDHLMSLAVRLPSIEQKMGESISGIGVDYRNSPIVEDHAGGADGPHAGERAPDVRLDDGGMPLKLYDLIADRRHLLLLLGDAAELAGAVPEALRQSVTICTVAVPGTADVGLIDRDGEVAARYGRAAYLIRPDGFVAFRSSREEIAARLPGYLTKLFAPAGG